MKTFVANANRGIIGGRPARPAPLLAVLAALLVAGCSTMKLAYEQAPSTTAMSHIAIQEALDGRAVDWLEHVTDDEYRGQ